MSKLTLLFKQGAYFSTGVLLSRIFSAIAFIIMARSVGPADFGLYASLWVILEVTMTLSESGMTTGIKRDGSRNHQVLPVLLGNTLLTKAIISVIITALAFGYFLILQQNESVKELLFPLTGSACFLLFAEPFFAALQVKQQQKIIAMLQVGKSFLLLSGFTAFSLIKVDVSLFLWFQTLLNCLYIIIIYYTCCLFVNIKFNISLLFQQYLGAFSFGIANILYVVYTKMPLLALTYFASNKEVGFFASAYRFIELFFIIAAAACNNAFLPALFKVYKSNKEYFFSICHKIQVLFSVLGIIFSAMIYVFGEYIIIFLQGEEYRPAVQALQIMSWSVMLNMAGLPSSISIIASDHMRMFKYFQLYAVGFVFTASLFVIKPYGFLGASYTICTLWMILLLFYFYYASYKHFFNLDNILSLLMLPTGLTVATAFFVKNSEFPLLIEFFLFFFIISLVWMLTFFYKKKTIKELFI